jgi:hypothetical protein
MTEEHTQRLNAVAAHLDSLHDLLIKLAQGSEGERGDDLTLAGTFYSLANSVESEKEALDAAIETIKLTTET